MNHSIKLILVIILAISVAGPSRPGNPQKTSHNKLNILTAVDAQEVPASLSPHEELEQEVRAHPDSSEAHYKLGLAYIAMPYNATKAVKAFKEALKLDPKSADACKGLGWAYLDSCSYYGLFPYKQTIDGAKNAIKAFQQAIRLQPEDVGSHIGMGISYAILGNQEKAIEIYHQILKQKPGQIEIYSYLGRAYIKLGNLHRAVQSFEQKIRLTTDRPIESSDNLYRKYMPCSSTDIFEDYLELADAHLRLNQYREAAEIYKQAIILKPENELGYYQLALTYLELKDKESASSVCQNLLALAEKTEDKLKKTRYKELTDDILRKIQE